MRGGPYTICGYGAPKMDDNFDAGIRTELDSIMKNVDNIVKRLEEAGYGNKGSQGTDTGEAPEAMENNS